jgi:hypothetical protein
VRVVAHDLATGSTVVMRVENEMTKMTPTQEVKFGHDG